MRYVALIYSTCDTFEVVSLELSQETLVLGLSEVGNKDGYHCVGMVYPEGFAIWAPRNNIAMALLDGLVEQFVQLRREVIGK